MTRRTLVAVGWTLLIVGAVSIPGPNLPDFEPFSLDKWGHLGMFAGFAVLWLRAYPHRASVVAISGVLLALATELWQQLAPFIARRADPLDVVADLLGLALGFFATAWHRRRALRH